MLQAGIPLHAKEFEYIEIAELGLGELVYTGVQILTIASTEWVGVKILILKPNQFFPQHRHPPSKSENYPGKIEVLRGQYGKDWLYVPGAKTPNPKVTPPPHLLPYCTVWHEVPLGPGDQFICLPNTWHWFQAGPKGAVIWSISSKVTDEADQFFDPQPDICQLLRPITKGRIARSTGIVIRSQEAPSPDSPFGGRSVVELFALP